jgi:hypothetical protein
MARRFDGGLFRASGQQNEDQTAKKGTDLFLALNPLDA